MKARRLLLSLALAVVVVLMIAIPASAAQFTDAQGPYAASVTTLSHWGIVGGYADGTFKPDNTLTRQQVAKMTTLAAGYAVTSADVCAFKDAPAIDPANPLYPGAYVAVAARNNVILGYPGNVFGFYDNVTRQQLISMAVRAAGSTLAVAPVGWQGIFDYSDAAHGQDIKAAEYNGWLAGIDDVYSWDVTADATRGEAAQILAQLLAKVGNPAAGASGAIRVTGAVDSPMGLTAGRLTNMGLVTLTVEHPKNGPTQYTGVRFSTLFTLLGVQSSAVNMNVTASDGYKWSIKIADIKAQADAMLAVDGSKLNLVMPGQAGKAWVKDLASIEFE
jgi:hypothetical protein